MVSHNDQCNDGNSNKKTVVTPERSKGGTGIRDVNQIKEIRHYNTSIVQANGSDYPTLRQLVQSIERKREEQDEPHWLRSVEPLKH